MLHALVFSTQRDVMMLIAFESIVKCVEDVLLDDLGRDCDRSELIPALIHEVLFASHEFVQLQRVFIHCLIKLRLSVHLVLWRDRGSLVVWD